MLPGGGDGWDAEDKAAERDGAAAAERRGLIISFATLVLSVPALIGPAAAVDISQLSPGAARKIFKQHYFHRALVK